jgi:hypothetical protein
MFSVGKAFSIIPYYEASHAKSRRVFNPGITIQIFAQSLDPGILIPNLHLYEVAGGKQ